MRSELTKLLVRGRVLTQWPDTVKIFDGGVGGKLIKRDKKTRVLVCPPGLG